MLQCTPVMARRALLQAFSFSHLGLSPLQSLLKLNSINVNESSPLRSAVVTSPAWAKQKDVAAREGLVAIAYERRQGEHSRLYQVRGWGGQAHVRCCSLWGFLTRRLVYGMLNQQI